MKRINIFKSGKHTSAAGVALDFSESDLQKSVEAYDPAIHEAPITIGHPKDNLPAYGWISGLEYSEERGMDAIPHQIDAEFAEMVAANKFKKISASFYAPDSPVNPVPGVYYPRHVAFLGAQPPAVKGLKPVEFNEAEEGIVEFEEPWDSQTTASIFRRLKELLIDKFSKEEAEQVIPDYAISELEDSARRKMDKHFNNPEPAPAFSEVDDMTKEELEARERALKEREDKLEADEASFSESQKAVDAEKAKLRRTAIEAQVGDLVKAGKVLPAEKAKMVDFMAGLDESGVVEFSEGDETKTQPSAEFLAEFLEGLPKRVDTSEHSHENGDDPKPAVPGDIANRALEYMEEQRTKGVTVSATQAVKAVQGEFESTE